MKKRMNKRHSMAALGKNMFAKSFNEAKAVNDPIESASYTGSINVHNTSSLTGSQQHSPRTRPVSELPTGVANTFDPSLEPKSEGIVDLNDAIGFLQSPLPKGLTLQCYIDRFKDGVKKLYPKYELYLKENDEFLVAARKRANNKTSNYVISTDKDEITKLDTGYIGKLRSNLLGTEFVLYDIGLNPKTHKNVEQKNIRKELAGMIYKSNILGSRGPRKMTVLLPAICLGEPAVFKPPISRSIIKSYKDGDMKDLLKMENRAPKWNETVGAYVLNFNGRVTMASVKNFQLGDDDDSENTFFHSAKYSLKTKQM